jgi:hypothetical protein
MINALAAGAGVGKRGVSAPGPAILMKLRKSDRRRHGGTFARLVRW